MKIIKAEIKDVLVLGDLARRTFVESHGHSASRMDIDQYLTTSFSDAAIEMDLADAANHIYLLWDNDELLGYSKIVFNSVQESIAVKPIAKLERVYLLESSQRKGLGKRLLQFNLELAKSNLQKGMWLNVWIENKQALQFYSSFGFRVFGTYDFQISETHSNPNYQMFAEF